MDPSYCASNDSPWRPTSPGPEPQGWMVEIVEDLYAALEAFQAVSRELEPPGDSTA